jgi:hypothetical protein
VKEMYLEELIHLVVVMKLSTAPLEMLNPVETCIPDLWRKTILYSTTLYVSHKCTGSLLSANILLERVRQELYTAIGYRLMRPLFVHPEAQASGPIFVEKEVAK